MPSHRRARPALSAALVGLALATAACSTSTTGTGTPAAAGASTGDDSVTAMLALLPPADPAELGVVTVSRWHAAAEAYGVPVPPAGATADEVLDYLSALTTGDGGVTQASELLALTTAATTSTEEEFGFGRQQIAADVVAGTPPRLHQAARGDFDPDAIAEATRSGPLVDDVEEVDVAGVRVLRWRDDLDLDLSLVTALSRTGSAGRLALPDDATMLYAGYDDGIAGLIDAAQGGESLADDEDMAAVAAALDAEDVLSAQLTPRPDGSDLPYAAVGIGIAEDDGARVVLAYSTGSESDAQSLADAVEDLVTSGRTVAGNRPWSDLLADPEVRTDGALVVATFNAVSPAARWPAFLHQREELF